MLPRVHCVGILVGNNGHWAMWDNLVESNFLFKMASVAVLFLEIDKDWYLIQERCRKLGTLSLWFVRMFSGSMIPNNTTLL